MTDYDAIIRIASLWIAQKLDDTAAASLPQVDEHTVPLVVMAAKLMEGKRSGVHTDDPDTIERCCLLAQHIGASVEIVEEEAGQTSIFFNPPRRQ